MTDDESENGDVLVPKKALPQIAPALRQQVQALPRPDLDAYPANFTLLEREVAALLNLSVATLRIWRHRKVGPTYEKHARAVRYRVDDLRDFIDARRVRVESTDLRPDSTLRWQERKRVREPAEVFGETA